MTCDNLWLWYSVWRRHLACEYCCQVMVSGTLCLCVFPNSSRSWFWCRFTGLRETLRLEFRGGLGSASIAFKRQTDVCAQASSAADLVPATRMAPWEIVEFILNSPWHLFPPTSTTISQSWDSGDPGQKTESRLITRLIGLSVHLSEPGKNAERAGPEQGHED